MSEYSDYRAENNQILVVGIFGEDLERALENPGTLHYDYLNQDGNEVSAPVLVPVEALEWYNTALLERTYGKNADIYCYVHPPTADAESHESVKSMIEEVIERGGVVVTEKYSDDNASPIAELVREAKLDQRFRVEAFGGEDGVESRVDFFVGHVAINSGAQNVSTAPTMFEAYEQALDEEIYERDARNGPSLVASIEGDEAEHVWSFYEKPFEGLGENDPTLAGFDKEALIDILKDRDIAKVVNRVDGEITTLMIFLQDINKAPWFNKSAFEREYEEYYATNNIFIFPGIVSDESRRGNRYSADVVDFSIKLAAKRGADLLITFECTEVSTTYIPDIVTDTINASGVATVSGLDKPVGAIEYYALSKQQVA